MLITRREEKLHGHGKSKKGMIKINDFWHKYNT